MQLNIKKKKSNQKMGRRPTQTFLQRIHSYDQKHMKRYSISLIREMQIKSTMRHHFIMVRMVIIIKTKQKKPNTYIQTINAEEGVEKREPLTLYKTTICCAQSLSHVPFFETPQAVARYGPLSTGILQARMLKWVAIFFSRRFSQPRDRTQISHIAGILFTV